MIIRTLGTLPYLDVLKKMQSFTESRTAETEDELWIVEHPAVFTQGQAGKPEHLLFSSTIPVVQSDRGGQITYHGPGQLIIYTLIDFKRLNIPLRTLIEGIENAIIATLAHYGVTAWGKREAPGVYVHKRGREAKIASLGLRIKKGAIYHGLSLNVSMDLTPFTQINPCGYAGLPMAQITDFRPSAPPLKEVGAFLCDELTQFVERHKKGEK